MIKLTAYQGKKIRIKRNRRKRIFYIILREENGRRERDRSGGFIPVGNGEIWNGADIKMQML